MTLSFPDRSRRQGTACMEPGRGGGSQLGVDGDHVHVRPGGCSSSARLRRPKWSESVGEGSGVWANAL